MAYKVKSILPPQTGNNGKYLKTDGTSTTGLTTALPATAAAPGTVTTSFWGCVS